MTHQAPEHHDIKTDNIPEEINIMSKPNKPQIIKIYTLYRPLLLQFRSSFCQKFTTIHSEKKQKNWTINHCIINTKDFMSKTLGLPKTLLDHDYVLKMATLLLPAFKYADEKQFEFRQFRTFSSVFTTNREDLRNQFFSDPLTKHLWSNIFLLKNPEICIAHLRRIRSQPNGELKYDRLFTDMLCNEINFNFTMLPEEARNRDSNKLLTDLDAYNDLIDHGAHIDLDVEDSRSQTSS